MDGVEPDCLGSGCLVGFDRLTDEDLRLLEVRFMLVHLGEMGLGEKVAREYRLDRGDLLLIALMEAECRAIAAEDADGKRSYFQN